MREYVCVSVRGRHLTFSCDYNPSSRLFLFVVKLNYLLTSVLHMPDLRTCTVHRYLRGEFPTVAFKASTQQQRSNLSQSSLDALSCPEALLQSQRCLGAAPLLKLLGNYCRNRGLSTGISVGVVGLPNVGKSSVINSLKRSRACGVGATPGVTRGVQEVQLDSRVRLLDSPGLVLMSGDQGDAATALRNAFKIEQLDDPALPVEAILRRADRRQLMLHYKLPMFTTTAEFLLLLARRQGKLKKGGIPDAAAAARLVLQDWNTGRIKYYTQPPESAAAPENAAIVAQFAAEFDLDAVTEEADREMEEVEAPRGSQAVPLAAATESEEAEEEEMETAEPAQNLTVSWGEGQGLMSGVVVIGGARQRACGTGADPGGAGAGAHPWDGRTRAKGAGSLVSRAERRDTGVS